MIALVGRGLESVLVLYVLSGAPGIVCCKLIIIVEFLTLSCADFGALTAHFSGF